jgi:phage protein D
VEFEGATMTTVGGHDKLVPAFSVRINGSPLPNKAAADLIAGTVLEDVDAPSMFSFKLAGWDPIAMTPKWIDDALFREGGEVEIAVGYSDKTVTLIRGEITGLEPDFGEGQPPTFTVRGYDRCHRLARARKTRSFTQCKDSDIASQLASENGLRPTVDDSQVKLPYVLQHNQTDHEFLATRADRIGYEFMVRDKDLLFRRRPIDASPTLTLHREVELLAFHPRLSTMGQVSELQVRGWNPAQKQEISARGGQGDEPKLMSGSASGPAAMQRAFDAAASARVRAPVQSQEEADLMARQGFARMALRYICTDGVCIGDPSLHAGTVVKIEGLGERFSGPYYVTSTEHLFGGSRGYRTRFAARRNAS